MIDTIQDMVILERNLEIYFQELGVEIDYINIREGFEYDTPYSCRLTEEFIVKISFVNSLYICLGTVPYLETYEDKYGYEINVTDFKTVTWTLSTIATETLLKINQVANIIKTATLKI